MLSGSRLVLDGQTYNVVITDDAIARVLAAGVDLWHPPLRREGAALEQYLTVVFAASAHIEADGELRWAELTASELPDMLTPFQGEDLLAAVNQALVDWARRSNAAESPWSPQNGGEWN